MQRRQSLFAFVLLCVGMFLGLPSAFAQVNTATLSGVVTDQQGLAVRGAKITVTNSVTGAERTSVADDGGHYTIVGLVPGEYKLHAEGGSNFAAFENPSVQLRVGTETVVNVALGLSTQQQSVTVTTESAPIETTRSESAQAVDERQIDNLPINGRNYVNFTLINSQVTRDVSPTIGPAPNSGLSISGARGRGNMVSVDGANSVDQSVEGIRSTVSQEAVQEFQMILSNYNAEYGNATGGVVNIVTKSGTNDFHGDVFGYLRNRSFQARNPFSFDVDPTTGNLEPIKQAYTRVQTGATIGGALKKDKTFYFFSYEYTQREETGFSSIGENNFDFVPVTLPTLAGPLPVQLTTSQAAAVNSLLSSGIPAYQQLAVQYGVLMGSASSVALNRLDYGAVAAGLTGGALNPGPGAQFPIPVACPPNQTVNLLTCSSFGEAVAPLPASYVGLNSIRGNFPVMEKTSLWSGRLDQHWNSRNSSFLRVGVSPSQVTGLQSTSQNQVLGQNAATRVGASHYRDVNATFENDTVLNDSTYNEFRFQFARRGLHFGFSPEPGGGDIGVNIPGYAYFGREPYSTVDRIERRFQFADNGTITRGRHTFKVGVDFTLLQLRSAKQQIFELDFGGVVDFGGLPASTFGLPNSVPTGPSTSIALPGATTLQAYGLGIPTDYIQGIGTSNAPFDDIPIGFFAQDSWRVNSRLTLNYGLRYDPDITPLFAPATSINAAAEKDLGVIEGVPRQYKDVAPRFGLAWDPWGDGKTVVRAGFGLFYDHPLLAIAFDSVTADGGRSVQLLAAGGQATACALSPTAGACGPALDSPLNLNGSTIFQGVLNALPNMYYLPNQQRFNPFPSDSLFANQNYLSAATPFPLAILPFTLPVDKNFRDSYAEQANLTVERVLGGTWKLSAGYQWTRGVHLFRPIDINSTDPVLLTNNLANADAAGLGFSSPFTVAVPTSDVPATTTTCGLSVTATGAPGILGVLNGCPAALAALNGKYVGTPAFFNYFRKSGPNPSFAGLVPGGYGTQVALASAAGFPTGFGSPVPFNSVDTQVSDAFSTYNALTINLEKRFSRHFQLLSSYTWSHSIDDGTDLQSTLEPQDSRFPQYEKGNSVNDQRQRWVTSGVFQSSPHVAGQSFVQSFFSNWTVAPLIEVSSGRPFNVISGEDTRLELSSSQARPNLGGGTTSPYIHGVSFGFPTTCLTNSFQPFTVPGITPPLGCIGTLGRDKFTMPMFFQFDMRFSKGINLGEHLRMDLIADAFNLFNHTNIIAVNQLCDPLVGTTCAAGQPSAAADARQFQFALKLSW
ncbi:MAG TPA: TonB-dependent receptor [Candidatus Acidoferrum sp.]|nr:TonB-dependent receptor [Candidatus Acidoferrum sp.]